MDLERLAVARRPQIFWQLLLTCFGAEAESQDHLHSRARDVLDVPNSKEVNGWGMPALSASEKATAMAKSQLRCFCWSVLEWACFVCCSCKVTPRGKPKKKEKEKQTQQQHIFGGPTLTKTPPTKFSPQKHLLSVRVLGSGGWPPFSPVIRSGDGRRGPSLEREAVRPGVGFCGPCCLGSESESGNGFPFSIPTEVLLEIGT